MGNLITNFGISKTFRFRLMGQHLSYGPRNLRHSPLTLEVMALVDDTGFRTLSVYQVSSFVGLSVRKILLINRSGDLDL